MVEGGDGSTGGVAGGDGASSAGAGGGKGGGLVRHPLSPTAIARMRLIIIMPTLFIPSLPPFFQLLL